MYILESLHGVTQHLMILGLAFLRRLFEAHSIEEKAFILKKNISESGYFISSALAVEPYDYMMSTDRSEAHNNKEEFFSLQ